MASIRQTIQNLDQSISNVKSNLVGTKEVLDSLEAQIASMEKLGDLNDAEIKALQSKRETVISLRVEQQKTAKEKKDSDEQERKALENIMGKNKGLEALVTRLAAHHKILANSVWHGAQAYKAFTKEANLGSTVQHIGNMIPGFKNLGNVLGFIVGMATNAQDRIQGVNKTIIDASASTGRFGVGMGLANRETLAMTSGFAKYGQAVGMASKEIQQIASGLGKVGFSMEEMGIDTQTGQIKTLSSALEGNAAEWGALSTVVGAARSTGLDYTQVASQLQTQVKDLGDSVQGTGKTFAALSVAANRSRLSTGILLPVLQGMQQSFKMLGIDSAKAVEMLGKVGEVAKKAGVGAGAAVSVMGTAISQMAQMDMGKMAFLGQQLGMGGGLGAGLQFRKQISGKEGGGAEIAQQIGQVIGKLMGGTGDLISEEQAIGNERLAAIRIGQEQLAAQMFGFSQNDAKVFINISKQLAELDSTGQGDSEEAKRLNKQLSDMKMSENDYRKKTLTAQQKIQTLLELISTLVGNAVALFVRAFAGGAAKSGSFGKDITAVLNAINKGEGLDQLTDRIAGIGKSFEEAVGPAIEKVGEAMGKHWILTLMGVFGGPKLLSITGGIISSFMQAALTASLLGKMGGAAGGAARAATSAIPAIAGSGLRALITGFAAVVTPLTVGVGALAVATYLAVDAYTESVRAYRDQMNKEAAAATAFMANQRKTTVPLEKMAGIDQGIALALFKKVMSGNVSEQERAIYKERQTPIDLLAKAQIERILSEFNLRAADPNWSPDARKSAERERPEFEMMLRYLELNSSNRSRETDALRQNTTDQRTAQAEMNSNMAKEIAGLIPSEIRGSITITSDNPMFEGKVNELAMRSMNKRMGNGAISGGQKNTTIDKPGGEYT